MKKTVSTRDEAWKVLCDGKLATWLSIDRSHFSSQSDWNNLSYKNIENLRSELTEFTEDEWSIYNRLVQSELISFMFTESWQKILADGFIISPSQIQHSKSRATPRNLSVMNTEMFVTFKLAFSLQEAPIERPSVITLGKTFNTGLVTLFDIYKPIGKESNRYLDSQVRDVFINYKEGRFSLNGPSGQISSFSFFDCLFTTNNQSEGIALFVIKCLRALSKTQCAKDHVESLRSIFKTGDSSQMAQLMKNWMKMEVRFPDRISANDVDVICPNGYGLYNTDGNINQKVQQVTSGKKNMNAKKWPVLKKVVKELNDLTTARKLMAVLNLTREEWEKHGIQLDEERMLNQKSDKRVKKK